MNRALLGRSWPHCRESGLRFRSCRGQPNLVLSAARSMTAVVFPIPLRPQINTPTENSLAMKTAALPATGCAVGREMAKPLSIQTNFAWSLIGNVGYAGCQWTMLVVIAKLGSAEMVGQFALALALTAPVMMFAQLQLRTLLATDARNEFQFLHYLATCSGGGGRTAVHCGGRGQCGLSSRNGRSDPRRGRIQGHRTFLRRVLRASAAARDDGPHRFVAGRPGTAVTRGVGGHFELR